MAGRSRRVGRFHFIGDGNYSGDGGCELQRLWELHEWKPLHKCDGRYVQRGTELTEVSLKALCERWNVTAATSVLRFEISGEDNVECLRLTGGGGLLTYCKPDGKSFVHTLNTESGLCRKLIALRAGHGAELVEKSLQRQCLFGVLCRLLQYVPEAERTRAAPAVAVALRFGLARCALREEEEKKEGAEEELEQQTSEAQASFAIDCGICEPTTAESQPSPPPLRAERKKKRSVDFLLEGRSVQTNRHLARFAAAPYLDRLLTEPAFSSMLSRTSKVLRKELIEAYVVVEALEKMLALDGGGLRLGHSTSAAAPASPDGIGVEVNDPSVDVNDSELTLAAGSASGQGEAAAVVDLCCGKGFLSVILALEYPNLPVIMVDSNERKSPALASLLFSHPDRW